MENEDTSRTVGGGAIAEAEGLGEVTTGENSDFDEFVVDVVGNVGKVDGGMGRGKLNRLKDPLAGGGVFLKKFKSGKGDFVTVLISW